MKRFRFPKKIEEMHFPIMSFIDNKPFLEDIKKVRSKYGDSKSSVASCILEIYENGDIESEIIIKKCNP